MSVAVYPGSFDPITKGHEDIIRRAAAVFDELIIGVLHNDSKSPLFTVEEKLEMINNSIADLENVQVKAFGGLLIDFVHNEKAGFIVRGLRNTGDFEYELNWAQTNSCAAPDIETVFLMTDPRYSFISSSAVREMAKYHGDISHLVNADVLEKVSRKYNN